MNGAPHTILQPTDVLASFLARVTNMVGSGELSRVSRAVLYIRGEEIKGQETPAIVLTYPIQSDADTIAELEEALMWMRTPVDAPPAPAPGAPS